MRLAAAIAAQTWQSQRELGIYVTTTELELIREWDAKCGANETTFFPVTKDRRRLMEHVDELRALLHLCRDSLDAGTVRELTARIDAALA
jgi:oligoribonuclease (3'-5' exoribonuclease)